jgi:hypothetical protein
MRRAALVEQLEGSLARLVALGRQELQSLLARRHLLAAHDPAMLVLHQILLGQTTGGVLRRAVEHLRLGANSHLVLGHLILRGAVLIAERQGRGGQAQGQKLNRGGAGRNDRSVADRNDFCC